MLIGYARVSTEEQSLDLQLDALKRAGCKRIFSDKVSTTRADHPGMADAVSHLRERDVLVIWKLDRLGRTVKGLVNFVADLRRRGCSSAASPMPSIPPPRPAASSSISWRRWPRWSGSCWPSARPGWPAAAGRGGRKRRMTPGKVESARKLLRQGMSPRDVAERPGHLGPDPLPRGPRHDSVSLIRARHPRDSRSP